MMRYNFYITKECAQGCDTYVNGEGARVKIFDEAWERTIKSRTLFDCEETKWVVSELKDKFGFTPIYSMDELASYAPLNEFGEHEFLPFRPQNRSDIFYKNLLVYLAEDDSLLGSNWKWEPSEKEPYYPGHPLMLMVRSARKQAVRVLYVATHEMKDKHPLLLERDFYNWAPIVTKVDLSS